MLIGLTKTFSVTVVTSVPWDMGMSTASSSTLYGKNYFFLFNWSLFQSRSYNCTSIGSWKIKKTNQCTAVVREPMAMQPAIARQNRRGIWLYNQLLCHRISDFFEWSNWGVQPIARPGTQYSFPYLREPKLR